MLTSKKISPHTIDRTKYYAPTENGVQCPYLSVGADGKPEIIEDPFNPGIRRCVCTQEAPFCSYHLGDYGGPLEPVTDGSGNPVMDEKGNPLMDVKPENRKYFCHRYLVWYHDSSRPPVDTHNRRLKIQGYELNWF